MMEVELGEDWILHRYCKVNDSCWLHFLYLLLAYCVSMCMNTSIDVLNSFFTFTAVSRATFLCAGLSTRFLSEDLWMSSCRANQGSI